MENKAKVLSFHFYMEGSEKGYIYVFSLQSVFHILAKMLNKEDI